MDKKNIEGLLGNYMVVPEIQREYVWGSNKNIVNQFIDSIKDNKDINVGFLYSYSNGNQEYIIDGQQRLTTLVLCLYYASLMQKEYYNDFKSLLKVNSPNMAFTYRVRSNTEEFMQCLFNSGLYKEKEIKNSKWYHTCYDSDLSISSMIALLNYLDEIKFNVKYNDILNIKFWYYPIDETSLGEDLYITMNSRGKTLDNAEKLKPLLFEKSRKELKNWGKIWDDWEDFFFTLLNGDDIAKINVAMNNLIRIVWELKTCGEHNELKPFEAIKDLNLSDIELFFDALKLIVNSEFKDKVDLLFGNKKSDESDGNFLILKSLLLICIKYREDEKMRNVEMKRVYQLIYNKIYRRGSQKHIPLLTLLKTYHERIDGNFYNIALDVCRGDGKDDYFDTSDLLMIQIMSDSVKDNILEISEVEKEFWKTQSTDVVRCHYIWKGDLSTLINWSTENNNFNIDNYRKYSYFFDRLYTEKSEHEIDLLRRAWIVGMKEYTPVKVGSYYTFCWEWEDWRRSITQHSTDFKLFMDNLIKDKECGKTLDKAMQEYIDNSSDKDYIEFAKDSYLIDFTIESDTCDIYYHWGTEDWWICTNGSRKRHTEFISRHNAYILKKFGANYKNNNLSNSKKIGIGDWCVWYWATSNDNCIAVENSTDHIVIDIRYDNKLKKCNFILKPREPRQGIEEKFAEGFIKKGNEYHLELDMQAGFNADLIKDKVLEYINRFEQQNKNEE
ncbi:DUF262 domain-containing protein [Phocaeicola plebeius]|jgi:uncharacterized protein with ParB-like and HNH nuclease domain|uniref:DUF262 domain-containing protein n=1 Tax=Phocaeicola plebeius TaxID=310297 RepID=A0A414RF94_9BACT|nr:DUF262 domain-containing protein [Phocaeicola plebeius]RHF91724.1 DUF262 domain-containing protein [Phocaeicola plebeius]